MVLQSFTYFLLLFHLAVKSKRERAKKITHGKMQMSLEAITMLMRFHHRSCCSSIRGIFHPYLENNCMFKIRDILPRWVSFYFKLESGHSQIGGSITYFYSAAIETADYSCLFAVLPSCCAVKFCSISSTFFPSSSLVNPQQNPFVNITIKLLPALKYHKQSACWCMYRSGGGEKKANQCDCLHQQQQH